MRIILVTIFLTAFYCESQQERPKNYRRFDEKLFHFGFMLGGNNSDFSIFHVVNSYEKFGLKSLQNKSGPGGQIGIVSTMKVGTPVVRLRFIPTLSFQERVIVYQFDNLDPLATEDFFNEERISSTNLDFPLMFQFRTTRLNNFASYILLGGQYTVDLQSQENASQDFLDPFIKIKKHDLQGQVGAGLEFFAPYFKFGVELKFSHSFKDVLVPDDTFISEPIDRLYNKVWWISLIFEG